MEDEICDIKVGSKQYETICHIAFSSLLITQSDSAYVLYMQFQGKCESLYIV